MKTKTIIVSAISAVLVHSLAPGASADVITDWNLITVNATKTGGFNSNLGTRVDAIEAVAVYDAVNSINRIGKPYHFHASSARPASAEAAAAQAAHDVLVNYFPAQQAAIDAALSNSLSAIPAGPAQDNGRAIGSASAADIIALRANDGSSPNVSYPGPANPGVGQWRPTPAQLAPPFTFPPGINEQWGSVTPFVLEAGDQFHPEPPPAVGSWQYNQALAEVKAIGSASNNVRTVDQMSDDN